MSSFALNLAVVLVLVFFVWQGLKRGLILSVCAVVIIFISAWSAGQIAGQYAEKASSVVSSVLNWLPDEKISKAAAEAAPMSGPINSITDVKVQRAIVIASFDNIGIKGKFSEKLVEKTMEDLKKPEAALREVIANNFLYGIAYLILAAFSFLVIFILLTLMYLFVAAVFKLPALEMVDKIGGGILGFVNGLLLMCFVGWVMGFIGVFLPAEMFEEAGLLNMFMNMGWLNGLLN